MNRLNPLHIVIFLVVVIFFLFFKLSVVKDEFKEAKAAYNKSELIAKELQSYKKLYGDKKRIERSLRKILAQRSLKSAKLKTTKKRDGMLIISDSIDLYALNSLMSKIFNGAYPVKILKIKKVDDRHAKLKMEISW